MNWNLDDICRKDKFDDLLKEIEKEAKELDIWWKKLKPKMSGELFKSYIDFSQTLGQKMARAGYLPGLMEAINQKDAKARLMTSKVQDLGLLIALKSRKFGRWIKGLKVEGKETLGDKEAKRLFGTVPDLEYGLNYSRLAAKYSLEEREEEIIDNKDAFGQGAISDLRGLIEAEMVYSLGKKKIKTQAELLKYVHSKNPRQRKEAYVALLKKQKEHSDKIFIIYQSVVKDWKFEAKIRGYKSPISMRNFGNQISDKAVESLLKVCEEKRSIFWRYFDYKANNLGKKKLNRFDLYAPMKSSKKREYSFEESKKMVIEAYKEFDKKFGELAENLFTEQHIDSLPKVNKISGAFCATVGPKITPYVLLNHTKTLRDVSTLAHELGHAIHSLLANKHYPGSQHANLPLAETASTLGEMILFEKMLAEEQNSENKKQMLWEKLADAYATILRQNYFVKFEIEAHELMGKGITSKELSRIYLANLREQFGQSVTVDKIFENEWMYISHIFESPFYCYAYNFGELLSLSLYSRYKREGKKFIPNIKMILEAGGSEDPTKLLMKVGIDIESSEFWKGGFEIIEGWLNELGSV